MSTLKETQLEVPASFDLLGKRFGKYRAMRELGRGGMGAVFEAVHEEIGGRAAVKVLHPELSKDEKAVARFFDEARAVRKVDHPGLVRIHDFDQLADGTIYILMEFLQGESLWERIERLRKEGKRLSEAEALRITRQVASALAAVHETGVIHRDLKPENVLIVKDPDLFERAKVLDFGIAKFIESEDRRTTTGTLIGTPYYMAPEQAQGGELGDRTDVYALGVMLYELLTFELPFSGAAMKVLANHMFMEPPPLRQLCPEAPPEIESLILKMMAKKLGDRPTMAQVVAAIDALQIQSPTVRPSVPVEVVVVPPKKRFALIGIVAAFGFSALGLGAYMALQPRDPTPATSPMVPPAKPVTPPMPATPDMASMAKDLAEPIRDLAPAPPDPTKRPGRKPTYRKPKTFGHEQND